MREGGKDGGKERSHGVIIETGRKLSRKEGDPRRKGKGREGGEGEGRRGRRGKRK